MQNHILEWSLSRPSPNNSLGGSTRYDLHYEKTHDVISNLGMRQGWGLAYNSHNGILYGSDGTSTIFEIDASNWKTKRHINVTSQAGYPVSFINELEMLPEADGRYLVANIFSSNDVHMIDLQTGKVVKTWNFEQLHKIQFDHVAELNETKYDRVNAVLNGIAYEKSSDSFILTGKDWDYMFRVRLDYKLHI